MLMPLAQDSVIFSLPIVLVEIALFSFFYRDSLFRPWLYFFLGNIIFFAIAAAVVLAPVQPYFLEHAVQNTEHSLTKSPLTQIVLGVVTCSFIAALILQGLKLCMQKP